MGIKIRIRTYIGLAVVIESFSGFFIIPHNQIERCFYNFLSKNVIIRTNFIGVIKNEFCNVA